jgi:phosphoadenosine phosphosulfate reductase
MMVQIDRTVDVFYLDTAFLFPETYKLRDIAAAKYGVQPIGYVSLLTPSQQSEKYGDALWSRDPDACCAIRKVEPNERALAGKRAWISGIRRDQTKQRAGMDIVEWAVAPGEDPRSGRWQGFDKTECGLHVPEGQTNEHDFGPEGREALAQS